MALLDTECLLDELKIMKTESLVDIAKQTEDDITTKTQIIKDQEDKRAEAIGNERFNKVAM